MKDLVHMYIGRKLEFLYQNTFNQLFPFPMTGKIAELSFV